METGSTRILVVPATGGGWELREIRGGPVLARPTSATEAVARASAMLERGRGGRILVLEPDGSVHRTLLVPPPAARPRWYVPPGTLRWSAPLLFGLLLLLRLLSWQPDAGSSTLVVGHLGLLAVSLAISLRSRALDRARGPASTDRA